MSPLREPAAAAPGSGPAQPQPQPQPPPPRRGGRPRGAPRERILDIALELFNEQGYDKTSLREIADRLGTTKAALYYHFEHKEDILLALHLRLHDLGHGMFDRIGQLSRNSEEAAGTWPELLDAFIDQVLSNRELFLLHERNRTALAALDHAGRHAAEHDDLEGQLRLLLASPAIPLAQRVRMSCSIGAVMATLIGAGEVFADVPAATLAQLTRDAVRDLLGAPRSAAG
jgi:AcrR family transcriptional regulator